MSITLGEGILLCISPSGTEYGLDLQWDVGVGKSDPYCVMLTLCLARSICMVGVLIKSPGIVSDVS